MKSLLILISLFCFSSIGFSQDSLSLSGIVTSAENGAAIPMAKVMATCGEYQYFLRTDLKGKFSFYDLPSGQYDLQFQTVGFDTTIIKAINIEPQKAIVVSAVMNQRLMLSCCMGCVFGPYFSTDDPAVPK